MTHRLALAAAALLACGDPPVTEIFVCYEIDPELASAGTVTRICALDDEGVVLAGCDDGTRIELGADGRPRSQAFVRSDATGLELSLEGSVPRSGPGGLEMRDIRQSIDLDFADGRIIDVTLRLENACLDRFCPDDETCVAGRCTPTRITNERCYTEHGQEPDPGCVSMEPRLTRGCRGPEPG